MFGHKVGKNGHGEVGFYLLGDFDKFVFVGQCICGLNTF